MIDLHMHTTASDGADSVAELLLKCERLGLSYISITDHNSMAGYKDLKDPSIRKLFSGKIMPGCEFSAQYKGQAIEILGYGIHPIAAGNFLSTAYISTGTQKKLQLEQMIECYRKQGFTFDEEQVRANINSGLHPLTGKPCKDPRTAFWMELNRYPENQTHYASPDSRHDYKSFMRQEFANINSPFFFSMEHLIPSAKTVCFAIKSMGGKAIIAHPGGYNQPVYNMMEELIQDVKPHGLEAWYSIHTPRQREELTALCKKYNLIFSGGSDYHGAWREERGNVLGMPKLHGIFPEQEILKWIEDSNLNRNLF